MMNLSTSTSTRFAKFSIKSVIRSKEAILLGLSLSLIFISSSQNLYAAKRSQLAPAEFSEQVQRESQGYKKCRQDVLSGVKAKKIDKKDVGPALNACRENFPGIGLYIDCKKTALKSSDKDKKTEGLKKCKRFLVAATFDASQAIPVFVDRGRIYFAGMGLNDSIPVKGLTSPNYDCKHVKDAIENDDKGEFILFGNHPSVFTGFADLPLKKLLQPLGQGKSKDKGQSVFKIAGFGRIFGDLKSKSAAVFFPSASCVFSRNLGDLLAGISIYYLIDKDSKVAVPYFGTIFYKKQASSTAPTSKVIETLIQYLGEDFKVVNKNSDVTFIASESITEFDEEGDPKNVCRKPRPNQMIAAVKSRQGDDKGNMAPQYLLLANIKNLCDHGDRLIRRLLGK